MVMSYEAVVTAPQVGFQFMQNLIGRANRRPPLFAVSAVFEMMQLSCAVQQLSAVRWKACL